MGKESGWTKEQWIIAISAAVLIIGAVLVWVVSYLQMGNLVSSTRTISGITTQMGYITGGIGIIIFIMFFLNKTPKLTAIILGIVSLLASGFYAYSVKFAPKQMLELKGNIGLGLYLTLIASICLIIGGILAKKKNIQ